MRWLRLLLAVVLLIAPLADAAATCMECQPHETYNTTTTDCDPDPGYTLVGGVPTLTAATCTTAGQIAIPTGSTTCIDCPEGYYIDTATNTCLACDYTNAATVYGTTAGTCKACPAGSYAAAEYTCKLCPAGFFSAAQNSASCTACAAGTYSSTGATACTTCTAGSYCPGGSAGEIACPPGSFSAAGAIKCEYCAPLTGFYADNRTSCKECPAGQIVAADLISCQACEDPYYVFDATGDVCTLCPNYTVWDDTTKLCVPIDGYYTDGADVKVCPAGSACTKGTATPCTGNTYSMAGSATCTTCPTGQVANATFTECEGPELGEYYDTTSSAIVPCAIGTYGTVAGVCEPCGPGTYTDATGQTACKTCAAGNYILANACVACTAGNYCPGDGAQEPCPAGTYSAASATTCLTCPEGQYVLENVCTACDTDETTVYPGSACGKCPTGTILDNFKCVSCPQPLVYTAGKCLPPAGYYNSGVAPAVVATICPVENSCAGGNAPETPCATGYFAPLTGMIACLDCTSNEGYYLDADKCVACTGGEYLDTDTCENCTDLTYAPPGSEACTTVPATTTFADSRAGFKSCPADNEPDTDGVCQLVTKDCGEATYNGTDCVCPNIQQLVAGATDAANTCVACPGGYSCNGTATTTKCAAGSVAAAGAGVCTACKSPLVPNADQTQCVGTCPTGATWTDGQCVCDDKTKYYDAATSSCAACPAAHSCDGTSDADHCPDGLVAAAGAGVCSACPTNYQANSTQTACVPVVDCGSQAAPNDDLQCICNITNQLYIPATKTCVFCPAGYSCNGSSVSTPCAAGYYAPYAAGTCIACVAPNVVSTDRSTCFDPSTCGEATYNGTTCVCAQTNYYLTEGDCEPCPAGYSCNGTSIITPCVGNTVSAVGAGYCTECSTGLIPNIENSSCVNPFCCNKSYFNGDYCVCYDCSTYWNGEACTECPAGYACDGTPVLTACTGNTFSQAGMGFCDLCPEGTYATQYNTACVAECGQGAYFSAVNQQCCCTNTSQYYDLATETCVACPDGYICNGCTAVIDVCGEDAYWSPVSKTCCCRNSNQYWSANGCTECPSGYLCNGCTAIPRTCGPDAVYNPIKQKCCCESSSYYYCTTAQACLPCPAGSTCDGCTASPIICPNGVYNAGTQQCCCASTTTQYYYDTTAMNCVACPAGYTCNGCTAVPTCCDGAYWNPTLKTCCCANGEIYDADTDSCVSCPAGYTCDGCTASPICGGGDAYYNETIQQCCCHNTAYYYNTTLKGCAVCPPGLVCDGCGAIAATCPSNAYYNEETSQCCCNDETEYFSLTTGECECCPPGSTCDGCVATPICTSEGSYFNIVARACCCTNTTQYYNTVTNTCTNCAPSYTCNGCTQVCGCNPLTNPNCECGE